MKIVLATLSTILLLSGCATLAPVEVRKAEYIEKTTVSKEEAYSRALAYFGKNFGDSNHTIKVQNKEAGQIVAKGLVDCTVLSGFGDINPYYLDFSLDFTAKDKRVRILFENLVIKDRGMKDEAYSSRQLTDAAQVEKAKVCLEPMKAGILSAINGGASKDW